MRLMIDGTPLYRKLDGVGRYTTNMIFHCAKIRPDWSIYIINFIDDRWRPFSFPALPKNVSFVTIPIPRRIYQFCYRVGLHIAVDRLIPPFDAMLCLNFTLFPYINSGKKAIAIHDFVYHDIPYVVEKRNLDHLKSNVPFSIPKADLIVATSHFTKTRLQQLFGNDLSIVVAENAVDKQFYNKRKLSRDGRIIAIGTVEPRKNLITLLKAYNQLPEYFQAKHPLYIIGKQGWGDDLDLQKLLSPTAKKYCVVTGYVDDKQLIGFYQKSSLFIAPSIYEGFGLPLLEAMLARIPVIASDIPPFRDIGEGVVSFFPAEDYRELAYMIKDQLTKDTVDISRLSKAQTKAATYTWENSARKLCDAIESAV